MIRLRNLLGKANCLAFAQILIAIVSVSNAFPSGKIFSAGDSFQYVNLDRMINELGYVWSSFPGEGGYLNIFSYSAFYFILKLIGSVLNLSASSVSSVYYFLFLSCSFWSFFLSTRFYINNRPKIFGRTAFSLAYALNSYTFYAFHSGWGFSPFLWLYPFIPLVFGVLYGLLTDRKTGFFNVRYLIAIPSVMFLSSISYGNMAFFMSLNILLALFVILVFIVRFDGKADSFLPIAKKVLFFYVIYFLACFWSVVPQIPSLLGMAKSFQNGQSLWNLRDWILWQSMKFPNPFFMGADMLRHDGMAAMNYFSIILFIAVAASCLFIKKRNRDGIVFIALLIVDIFLLNKGKGILSEDAILKIFGNSVLGSIRSIDKTMIFVPFLAIMALFINISRIKEKKARWWYFPILFFSLATSFPLIVGNNIVGRPLVRGVDENVDKDYMVKIPEEYFNLANPISQRKENSKMVSIPYNVINSIGWSNFPKWGLIGVDPTIQFFNQSIVQMNAPNAFGKWNYGRFWNDQSDEESKWMINFASLLNIRYVIYHKDVAEKFIQQTESKIDYYEKDDLLKNMDSNDYFNFYRVNDNYFLSHFYVPERAGITSRPVKDFPKILASEDWKTRSAVFFRSQNPGKDETLDAVRNIGDVSSDSLPTLEFRKINPTKYRVRIHAAQGEFPLVFSESFHDGWKAYLEKASAPEAAKLSLDGYRVLDGNSDDQADADELKDYVSKGWVTDLGNGNEKTIEHKKWEDGKEKKDYDEKCRIGFVSKDFQGTIQNDNLLGGSVFETWLKKPIDPADHLKANGYANAWLIDPEALCQGSGKCVRNPDGSYDMEIVVEFWPQRLFYIGLAVSGTTILSCLGYLAWDHRRRKREESAA